MGAYFVRHISHYCNVSVKKCKKMERTIIEYYDLTFVLKGSLTYIINGERCVINENDAILLKPGTARERLGGTEEVKYVSFNFQIFDEEELSTNYFLKNAISRNVRTLLGVFSQKYISQMYHSREKCFNLLNYILFEILDVISFESNNQNVISIMKFIDENISKQITLSMISEHVYLSKEYIAYIFKKEVNKTVMDYITERKMLIAKNMIKAGEMSLRDIASSLGYENYSYFSRVFKKHFNTTPIHFKSLCKL